MDHYSFQGKHGKQGLNSQRPLPRKLNGNVQLHFILAKLNDLLRKTLKLCTFSFFLFKTTRLGRGWSTSPDSFLKNSYMRGTGSLLAHLGGSKMSKI